MNKPETWRAICAAVALTLASAASCLQVFADSWGPPQKEHWSANKRFVLQVEYAPIRLDVICELVCRGHPAAVTKLRAMIDAWPNVDVNGTDNWLQRSVIQDFCKLIADRKLNEVRDNARREIGRTGEAGGGSR